jgi:CheY-like chemotaxis protein
METSLDAGLHGKKILIVDDELGILEVLEFMLSDAGFAVTTALNGQEAVARLEENTPDLVILDYMMPVLDGHGVIKIMRADPRYRDIPVILTSALQEATIRSRSDGYQAFLRKPYKTEPLMQEVLRWLKRSNEA